MVKLMNIVEAIEEYIFPSDKPDPLPLTWEVSLNEQHRITWAYAEMCHCTYHQAMEQLYYMSFRDAKEFLGET